MYSYFPELNISRNVRKIPEIWISRIPYSQASQWSETWVAVYQIMRWNFKSPATGCLSSLLRHTRVRDMCWLKSPACQDATSLRLHLIDFSPLCLLNCLLKSPARRPSLLRDTRVLDKCWLPVPLTTKCHITNCWASKPAYTQVRSQPPLSPPPPSLLACLLPPA